MGEKDEGKERGSEEGGGEAMEYMEEVLAREDEL